MCPERRRVDLLLTDVMMPEVNGRALAERLGEIAPDMRVLFMSGYSDEAVHRHGMLGEHAAFLEKPFTERAWPARSARSSTRTRPSPQGDGTVAHLGGAQRRPRVMRCGRAATSGSRAVANSRAVGRSRVGVEAGEEDVGEGGGVRRGSGLAGG